MTSLQTWRRRCVHAPLPAAVLVVLLAVCGCESVSDVRAGAQKQPASAASNKLYTPWTSLSGARLERPAAFAGNPLQPAGSYLTFLATTTVAARGNDVYIVDSGRAAVFRVDPYTNNMVVMAPQPAPPAWVAPDYPQRLPSDRGTKLYVANDRSLYVLDQSRRRVLHFSREGHLVREFQDPGMLARPVGFTVDESSGLVLIVDALYHNVVAFHRGGRVPFVIVPHENVDRDHVPLDIAAIASGDEGIYLVDRRKAQVLLMSDDGIVLDSFGQGILKQPWTVAVDRYRRVYVGDRLDNSIKVFSGGVQLDQIKGSDLRPGMHQISDLWVDEDLLYVADGATGRVDILRLSPPGKN